MPRQIFVGLPNEACREEILRVLSRGERLEPSVDFSAVAACTEGYSGSDLKEVVRAAALIPIREAFAAERAAVRAARAAAAGAPPPPVVCARPMTTADFLAALECVQPTGKAAAEYQRFQSSLASTFHDNFVQSLKQGLSPKPPLASASGRSSGADGGGENKQRGSNGPASLRSNSDALLRAAAAHNGL